MQLQSARSLRRSYLDWVEEQIEAYKESVSRADLLRLADQVVEDLRVTQRGQYQLTEVLLCTAVDRTIFRLLRLPGYQTWRAAHRDRIAQATEPEMERTEEPEPAPEPIAARA